MNKAPLLRGVLAASAVLAVLASAPAQAQQVDEVAVELPDTGVILYEQADDPKKVTAFSLKKAEYLRDGDAFTKLPGYNEIIPAPKGGRVAGIPERYVGNYDTITFIEQETGKKSSVKTIRRPAGASAIYWSRNGRKVVLTSEVKTGKKWRTTGFVVIDAVTRTAKAVTVPGVDKDATFMWTPDGRHLIAKHKAGTRVHTTSGKVVRTLPTIGEVNGGEDGFSPSGKLLLTDCGIRYTQPLCVWNWSTGKLVKRLSPQGYEWEWGWWDEDHLLTVLRNGKDYQVAALDMKGKAERVLADVKASAWDKDELYLVYTPN